jgi:hypothetical protein
MLKTGLTRFSDGVAIKMLMADTTTAKFRLVGDIVMVLIWLCHVISISGRWAQIAAVLWGGSSTGLGSRR